MQGGFVSREEVGRTEVNGRSGAEGEDTLCSSVRTARMVAGQSELRVLDSTAYI